MCENKSIMVSSFGFYFSSEHTQNSFNIFVTLVFFRLFTELELQGSGDNASILWKGWEAPLATLAYFFIMHNVWFSDIQLNILKINIAGLVAMLSLENLLYVHVLVNSHRHALTLKCTSQLIHAHF